MAKKSMFVNLPVRDLPAAKAFFESLGFSFNLQWTDDTAACMVVEENISVMLLTHPKFAGFTPKPIADAHAATEVLVALTADSREAVDEIVRKAVAGGGSTYNQPQDHGFMYGHGFQDLDGHIWEVFWLNPNAAGA